jgi:hypothetical protein
LVVRANERGWIHEHRFNHRQMLRLSVHAIIRSGC